MSTSSNTSVDHELSLYIRSLHSEVDSILETEPEGATSENVFTEHILGILSDAGETDSPIRCRYEKENKNGNTEFKINGYAIDETQETLDLFITHYQHAPDAYRLLKADFDKMLKWPASFANVALKGYEEEIEPSAAEAHALARVLRKHHKDFIRINIFLLSNGIVPHDPPKNVKLKGFDDLTINYHIWDIERLHRLDQSTNNRDPIQIDLREINGSTIPCLAMPSANEVYECYLAIVPGKLLATLYRNYGTRLLESNVRAFLQQTGKVNKGIMQTIRNAPEMFLPYNNGLAATALDVQTEIVHGQQFITGMRDFQIVNGGQTTASLFHTDHKHKVDLSKVFVQMKLTVIKDEAKKNAAVPDIARYANSQNKVSELDLSSNNPILQKLEELSRTVYAIDPVDRNKQSVWYFERVKGQYRESLAKEPNNRKEAFKRKFPKDQVIIKSEVAKYMTTWHRLPFHVVKGAEKNYNIYLKTLSEEFKKTMPGRVYWEDIVANAILFRETDKLFGRKGKDAIGDTNIKAPTVTYTLAYLHEVTKNQLDLGAIWRAQTLDPVLAKELAKGLQFVYEFLNNLSESLISEAAKYERTWDALRERKDHPFDLKVLSTFMATDAGRAARYALADEDADKAKNHSMLQRVTDMGTRFWNGLSLYALRNEMFDGNQRGHIMSIANKLLRNGSGLTTREVEKGNAILDHFETMGIDPEDIRSISKEEEKPMIDPEQAMQRYTAVPDSDWQRILDVGEQTSRLNYNETKAIRELRLYLKTKSKEIFPVDKLALVEDAIRKVKSLGVKI
jgi:hypothetical protein